MTIFDLYDIVKYIPTTAYLDGEYHEWNVNNPEEVETFIELEIIDRMNDTAGDFCEYMFTSSPPAPLIGLLKHKLELYVKWYRNCIGRVKKELLFRLDEFYVICDEWLSIINDVEKLQQSITQPKQETEWEKKYFAKAIEAGLMEKDCGHYRWLHNNGMKASLGYFINRVFNPKGTAQIPYKRLEILFGVTRLDTAIDQALTAKTPQKWRKEIDALFDD